MTEHIDLALAQRKMKSKIKLFVLENTGGNLLTTREAFLLDKLFLLSGLTEHDLDVCYADTVIAVKAALQQDMCESLRMSAKIQCIEDETSDMHKGAEVSMLLNCDNSVVALRDISAGEVINWTSENRSGSVFTAEVLADISPSDYFRAISSRFNDNVVVQWVSGSAYQLCVAKQKAKACSMSSCLALFELQPTLTGDTLAASNRGIEAIYNYSSIADVFEEGLPPNLTPVQSEWVDGFILNILTKKVHPDCHIKLQEEFDLTLLPKTQAFLSSNTTFQPSKSFTKTKDAS